MTDSTRTPSSGTDAADGSRFTVEDAGSTTDAADLFHNDTHARDTGDVRDAAADGPAPAVAAGGAHAVRPDSDDAGRHVAEHDHAGHDHGHVGHDHHDHDHDHLGHDHHDHVGHDHDGAARTGGADGLAALQGEDIGHVFDQTNGVIDGLDGDSDGTAASDDASRAERDDEYGTLDGRGGSVIDRDDR